MWATGCRGHVSDFDALARVVLFFFFLTHPKSSGVALQTKRMRVTARKKYFFLF